MAEISEEEVEWRVVNYLNNQGSLIGTSIGPATNFREFSDYLARQIGVPKENVYPVVDRMFYEDKMVEKHKSGECLGSDQTEFGLTLEMHELLNKKNETVPKKS